MIVVIIFAVIVLCFVVAFIEENIKMKKLTGKSLWWHWTRSNEQKKKNKKDKEDN